VLEKEEKQNWGREGSAINVTACLSGKKKEKNSDIVLTLFLFC